MLHSVVAAVTSTKFLKRAAIAAGVAMAILVAGAGLDRLGIIEIPWLPGGNTVDQTQVLIEVRDEQKFLGATARLPVTVSDGQGTNPIKCDRIEYFAIGSVDGVVELGKVDKSDLKVSGQDITVTLPAPELRDPTIVPKTEKVTSTCAGLATRLGRALDGLVSGEDLDRRNRIGKKAIEQLEAEAIAQGVLSKTKKNASEFVERIMKGAGYEKVTVVFGPPPTPPGNN